MRPARRLAKKKRSGGARSARNGTKKKRSVAVKTGNVSTRKGKRSAYVLRKRGRSMKRAAKPASRRSVKKTLHESGAYKKSLSETVEVDIEAVVHAAGLRTVTGIVAAEIEAGEGVEAEASRVSASSLSNPKTSKWTMIWHCSCSCKKVRK